MIFSFHIFTYEKSRHLIVAKIGSKNYMMKRIYLIGEKIDEKIYNDNEKTR